MMTPDGMRREALTVGNLEAFLADGKAIFVTAPGPDGSIRVEGNLRVSHLPSGAQLVPAEDVLAMIDAWISIRANVESMRLWFTQALVKARDEAESSGA
jgi:hypothetical protein